MSRWGEAAPADESEARSRLLDAAELCFSRHGVSKTSIADVALAAQVTRPTVYRYFACRDDLVRGVLMRAADRFGLRLAAHLEAFDDPAEAVVEGVLFSLREVPATPSFAEFFAADALALTSTLVLGSKELLSIASAIVRPIWRDVPDEDLEEVVEWVSRLMMSFLTTEGTRSRDDDEMRALLQRRLVPALGMDVS